MYYGKRIRLRRVDPARDLDDRCRWMNDPEVLRYLGMRPARLSRDEIREYGYTAGAYYNAVQMSILTSEYETGKGSA